ncbi:MULTISPECIES: sporulation histidine kinase inhibitor Sda [Alkalihalophilus]|uniref:Sporulation histidine kinase inhibitor Sda n=2 Tax=Alkalihalophilus pseudofirmus TaxID=79885 RepID=D3FUR2_ALKPO|nr:MULTISPECIES: sporulation histidine kinase inhibitor Sda [Alkalihalophilus]ADC50232.1 hypothetical protein BpOF4_10895 [Alkalihalophilus pseudofirmus OF4]MDV2886527.1 sporulation histidine kinase inhibitor Sda [Alkalihalophilus pseudofirmus]MEC2072431.1 sporulation histidine kinase inhibitor Sda [Alkalihalophilus marmarensis]MED1599975.1 sporulation histidine kinase inhibitor Sda [Alkalihalophilus marmarensis]WEG17523.1 sporulation histidine kinase inhibitor Sda [Alkalihalophilus pseudofirm
MHSLSDDVLIQSYYRAQEYGLDDDFLDLLFRELCKRNLQHLASQLSTHPQE